MDEAESRMSRHNRASVVSERESKVGAARVRGEGGAGCDPGPDGAVIAAVARKDQRP